MLAQNPAAAYRRVDLDARIEASDTGDLTRICLEEIVQALGQTLSALNRGQHTARDPLIRAQGIATWLARSVAPENPLREQMVQFYGGLSALIGRNVVEPRREEIAQARADFADLLEAAKRVG